MERFGDFQNVRPNERNNGINFHVYMDAWKNKVFHVYMENSLKK
jgi:hypothetical protein